MRSPPGSLPTKPPPTPMAKLGEDIREIDILLEASKRARESVADRAKGLYEEHLATQRKFDTEMQRETLSKKPGLRVDHSLMFHLGGNNDEDIPAAPGTAQTKKKEVVQLPEDAVVPPPPSYATESEAREWDDYYRYCARGALFQALDRGRMSELQLGQELAKIALEAESLPRYGDDEEYYDETAPEVLLDLARIRDVDTRLGKSKTKLYKARRSAYDEVKQRLDAYGPKKIKDPGMAQRMRDLGLRLPTGPALVQEALEEHALRKKQQKGLQLAPAPAPSEQFEEFYEEDFPVLTQREK